MTRRTIPKRAKRLPHKIIRSGEATGHHHALTANDTVVFETAEGLRFARIPTGSALTHQEHAVQIIAAGDYESGGCREFDHLAEEARAVID